jgi:hypothetical protein
MQLNSFDAVKWAEVYTKWQALIYWAASATQRARWAIVPDEPGNGQATLTKWDAYVQQVTDAEIPAALAVQDGMTVQDVRNLKLSPSVICVGGTTEWKWETVEMWAREFSRVHVLRCNSPEKLYWLEGLGVESCDGTGWNRGDRKQTSGLEAWARLKPSPQLYSLAGYVCRKERNGQMQWAF